MLRSLWAKNFVLLREVELDFGPGLNILTGETGAGKSIILEALGIGLGGRASTEMIRTGEERAVVHLFFDLQGVPGMEAHLAALGLEPPEDGQLLLVRELSRGGRTVCRVNGQVVPLNLYRQIGYALVALHGQHEYYTLFSHERHRELLDNFAGLQEEVAATGHVHREWQRMRALWQQIAGEDPSLARRVEDLRHQVAEIDRARLRPGEEEELQAERRRLMHAEKILRLTGEAYALLYGGLGDEPAVVDLLGRAGALLRELVALEPGIQGAAAALGSAADQVAEVARTLAAYQEEGALDTGRLEEIEQRLALLRHLKGKYGTSVEEVLRWRGRAAEELSRLEQLLAQAQRFSETMAELTARWTEKAEGLRKARLEAARKLEELVTHELASLEMGSALFRVAVTPLEEPAPHGGDRVEFLIATNLGEPLRPLAKVASGGELARIMLAVKALLAGADQTPTLVFDEVDTGVGGQALTAIAAKLHAISRHRQVIGVTHAAQIAALADRHWRISKETVDGLTSTLVEPLLSEEDRVAELARMLGGREAAGAVLEHARHLRRAARSATTATTPL
ncbi:MAG: DNA repair protein RecN [Desulfotomaculales bacterium]